MFLMRLWLLVAVVGANAFAAATIDPKSAAILQNAGAFLAAAKTAEVNLRLAVKVTNGPAPQGDLAADYLLSVQRPNKMALVLKEGNVGATVVSDGTNVITYLPQPKVYTVGKASDRIGGAEVGAPAGDLGSMAFITALFNPDPRAALLAGVLEAKFAGVEKIGDVECDRIDMKQEGLNWRLYATTGEKALVRKIEVTIPQLSMSMDFTGWKLNEAVPADRFRFVPPDGAKKVEKLLEEEKEEGEDSDLIGEEIPRFKLKTLDGETFDTGSLKKQTSILVVWTGEAAHCASVLQGVAELAGGRENLAIYGINVDEKPDKTRIKDFLGKQKAGMKTALDPKHEAIDKLNLEGVPMTFLIDKNGVIRSAFLGYHADFKTLVVEALDDLAETK